MNFVDNINPNPVASRNASDIFLTGVSASAVDITVSWDGRSFSFTAEPYQNSVRIRLSDILRSLRPLAFQEPTQNDSAVVAGNVTISASATGETSPTPWSRRVFHGGHDEALYSDLIESYWWTWRDQKCRTFVDGKEYLGAYFESGLHDIRVVARFSDGTTDQETLDTVDSTEEIKFGLFDVSYSRIAALFPSKTLVSYSVYRGSSSYPQVYEVSHLRPRQTFIFRKSLGMFDTIYATGVITDGAQRDVKTFLGQDRIEAVSDNDSRERISVNSGHIDTAGERTLWKEFLLSTDVWEYANGALRKIVVDTFDAKMPQGVSASLTFEYHYSAEPAGNGYEKSEL